MEKYRYLNFVFGDMLPQHLHCEIVDLMIALHLIGMLPELAFLHMPLFWVQQGNILRGAIRMSTQACFPK